MRSRLKAAEIADGPIFRRVTQWGTVGLLRLHPDAVRQILLKRAAAAGIEGTLLEPITPHGLRAGFITTAYWNGVPDEEIMGHTHHRSLPTGAEVAVAYLFDREQLLRAGRGATRAYYCPPFHAFIIQGAAAFAVAATQARLESVVSLTQWLASASHPAISTRQHWLADHLFAMLPGIATTRWRRASSRAPLSGADRLRSSTWRLPDAGRW